MFLLLLFPLIGVRLLFSLILPAGLPSSDAYFPYWTMLCHIYQVRALQEELSKATSMSAAAVAGAAAGAAGSGSATAARSDPSPSPPPAALDIKTETTILGELATAAPAPALANTVNELGNRSGSVEAWMDNSGGGGGGGPSPAEQRAKELEGAERVLENLREREQDAKGEAERLADELKRAR